MLGPFDVRRKAEPDFKLGWNSPPVAAPTIKSGQDAPQPSSNLLVKRSDTLGNSDTLDVLNPDGIPNANLAGLLFSNWKTGWLLAVPRTDGSSLCRPYVRFDATNMSPVEIEEAEFYGDFSKPEQKTTYGTGKTYWSRFANVPPLPPGYHRGVVVLGTVGILFGAGTCSTLPKVDFDLKVSIGTDGEKIHVAHGQVNPGSSVFYAEGAPGNPASVNP
jgi:hypothetical protein